LKKKKLAKMTEKSRQHMRQNITINQFFTLLYALLIGIGVPKNALAQFPVFEASVTDEIKFQDIPSASGIVKFQDSYYVIGDDSPYLFQLDSTFQLIKKIEIFSTKKLQGERLPKKEKPDFESITRVPWGNDDDLLVFGSGDGKEREVLIKIDIDEGKERVESYTLKNIYKHLHKESKSNEQLNIEGAGFWNDQLILLNRTDNTLFMIDFDDFKECVKGNDHDKPKVKSMALNLPSINGISARFSGLTVLPDEDIIIFTASVENDPNWIVQDDIVCSYLGIIDLNQLDNNEPICKLIKKNDIPIKEKVEAVLVIKKSETTIELAGVIDNDDGSSKLIKIKFKKNFN
jgi:hypothetical protein